jgi:hypothetical protein
MSDFGFRNTLFTDLAKESKISFGSSFIFFDGEMNIRKGGSDLII